MNRRYRLERAAYRRRGHPGPRSMPDMSETRNLFNTSHGRIHQP
jgi:hypothetical protein